MEWARAEGYPVPRVHSVAGPDMVLERVSGPTMLESLAAGVMSPADGGRLLAALLRRLHALTPPPDSPAGTAVRHRDLHPGNVVLAAAGPVVIDWRNSDVGEADVDVALTALILAEVGCGSGPYAAPARAMLDAFSATTGPMDGRAVDAAVEYRVGDPSLEPADAALVPRAAEQLTRKVQTRPRSDR